VNKKIIIDIIKNCAECPLCYYSPINDKFYCTIIHKLNKEEIERKIDKGCPLPDYKSCKLNKLIN
jgi:hypothetical protein